jgi:predicted NBD/HSP70 family sugar kinase
MPRELEYRGAYGDTIGRGHSVAVVYRAREEGIGDRGWTDVTKYWELLRAEGRAFSCNATDAPHLEQFGSVRTIMERLGLPAAPETLKAHWEKVGADAAEGARFDAVLRETGRLLGHALDNGIRLYAPEAVVVHRNGRPTTI